MKKQYYVRFEYQEGEDGWDDIYGPYTSEKAVEECEVMKKEFAYSISQGCASIYLCDKHGNPIKI